MRDTSFTDIAVSYERWVLFAMLIIVNQKKLLAGWTENSDVFRYIADGDIFGRVAI